MMSWRERLAETHSVGFELTRHFFARLLDIEIAGPGQTKKVISGVLGILISLPILPAVAYLKKYQALGGLGDAGLYRRAVLADHLFLILISFSLTALLTTLLWPSLFPNLRDYLCLAGLPVRPRQIFRAKLLSLLLLVGVFELSANVLPCLGLEAVTAGTYVESGPVALAGLLGATMLGGAFVFFVLLLVQATLLSAIKPAQYARISVVIQGVLMMVQLALAPFVMSAPGWHARMNYRGGLLNWFPPVWFLGLDQYVAGNPDPWARQLAFRAFAGVAGAAILAIGLYAAVYARHRRTLLETPVTGRLGDGTLAARMSRWVENRSGRSQEAGLVAFTTATLWRSAQHRMVLALFVAIGFAVTVNGLVSSVVAAGADSWSVNRVGLVEVAVLTPSALSFALLTGLRSLFRVPVELRANWLFRMNTGAARDAVLPALSRFLTWWVAIPVVVATAPVEMLMFGWFRGLAASVLYLLGSLVLKELVLSGVATFPFTSAYAAGKKPVIHLAIRYGGAAAVGVVLFGWIVWRASQDGPLYLVTFGLLLSACAVLAKLRRRRDVQPAMAATEEEAAEPEIYALALERD
jgi:hypothetical protein